MNFEIEKKDMGISIIFKDSNLMDKKEIMMRIVNAFPEHHNYLFEICGVDVERFIEDAKSEKYLLKVDKSNKLIKDLPILYLFSNNLEDVNTFGKYIGSFNEGYMYFYILNNENVPLHDEACVLDFIENNTLLTIEVDADGDALNLFGDINKVRMHEDKNI